MGVLDSIGSFFRWIRALSTNWYFWGSLVVLVGLAAGVFVVIDAVIMPSYTRHDVSTEIPNVKTLPFEQAKRELQQRNLRVQREVGRYNPNVDTGLVVAQTPLPAATVKPGRRVYLTVNAGEVPIVQLPDLTGMSIREAKNRLSSLGLTVGEVQEDSIPSPYANTITKQEPIPGDSLQEGKTVDLWYSAGLGDKDVEVPNLVGLRVREARRFLRRNELRSVVVDPNASAQTPDTTVARRRGKDRSELDSLFVRDQARTPGTKIRAGKEVRLYITDDAEEAARRRRALKEEISSEDAQTAN